MAWGGPHVRFGVGHSIRDISGVRQLSTEHTLGAGGLDEGPPLDGRQNVTSDSGRRSRRPRCRVRSVFSCPRVDRRDVLVRRGFGGQPPNKHLKLPGAQEEGRIALPCWPAFLSASPPPCAGPPFARSL